MELVVDAHIVCGFFKENVLQIDSDLTESAIFLFNRVGAEDRIYLDEGGQIENEWRQLVGREWFDIWLAELLRNGHAVQIPVEPCQLLKRKLNKLGFPTGGSRDIWYIRTAKAIVDINDHRFPDRDTPIAFIISEDLDFHEPQLKSRCSRRRRIETLLLGRGSIVRYMHRYERISINCIAKYREFIDK